MTPIERAARALCELDGHPPGATMDGKPLWQDYLPEVRAVVAALRDPSETMIAAARADDGIMAHDIDEFDPTLAGHDRRPPEGGLTTHGG